jgi:peptide/nickel transport system permease protein
MATTVDSAPLLALEGEPRPSLRRDISAAISTTLEGKVAVVLIAIIAIVVIFGPFLAPYPPNEIGVGPPLSSPSTQHLLGTDSLGRDVLSRLLAGGGAIIIIPFLAVTFAQILGGGLGMVAAYKGGTADSVITRGFDVILTIPPLLMVLVLIASLGTSDAVIIGTVALVFTPRAGRIIRGATRTVMSRDYVTAAHTRGESSGYVMFREILPNIAAPFVADFALKLTYGIIFVATLNYLGLGVQPPKADWAVMISDGQATITVAPWEVISPAIALALLSIGVNLFGDALTRVWSREADTRGGGL